MDVSAGCSSASLPFTRNAAFAPVRMYRDGVDITCGTPQSNNPVVAAECLVKVGEMINLRCSNKFGESGLVEWSPPQGKVIKDYQVNAGGKALKSITPFPLSNTDLLSLCVNGQASLPILSFAWWAAGEGFVETADFWTPLGGSHLVKASFDVRAPDTTATLTPYTGGVNGFTIGPDVKSPFPGKKIVFGNPGVTNGMTYSADAPGGWKYASSRQSAWMATIRASTSRPKARILPIRKSCLHQASTLRRH